MASKTWSSASDTVSMMTLTAGSCSRMRRVASTPSITGISTSITTRSGTSACAFSTASRPFSASPTTTMSSRSATSEAIAPRKRGWSSTSRMRIGSFSGIFHLYVGWPWMRSLRDTCNDTRSAPRGGVDGKATVQEDHPFTHGEEPEPVAVGQRGARVEAVPVVLDDEGRRRGGLGDADDRRRRTRVLADVRQRLLDDPDHLHLATRRQGQLLFEVALQRGLDAALPGVLGQVGVKDVQKPTRGRGRRRQAQDGLSDVAVGLLADVSQISQLPCDCGVFADLFT